MQPLIPLVAPTGIGVDLAGLRRNRGTLDSSIKELVIHYLLSAPGILAIMTPSDDILGNRFTAEGGPAIISDGSYFWRQDGVYYLNEYDIGLPKEFIEHGRARAWRPIEWTMEDVVKMDSQLKPLWSK